jgi:catechol 2,3-dioxygenase-like lactoylglutathione lyase family enzyme
MPETGEGKRAFSVPMMFHPSLDVFDLDAAERWYERVFGSKSIPLASLSAKLPAPPETGYPPNYSTFTPIADVLFDTIDPKFYVFNGVQQLPSIEEPHLRLISFYIDDMDAAHRALRQHGIRVTNQMDEVIEGDKAPTSYGSKMPLIFTLPEDTGLRYSFFPPQFSGMLDERVRSGWVKPKVWNHGPLGVERCSHHTILTQRPERMLKLLCDVLGGAVIHQGRNEMLGASCTYVHLGDSTMEIAVPDKGTMVHADWEKRAPDDTYHALTWKVGDLARAEKHLTAQGVRIRARSKDTLVTDPATSLGVPWGFTTTLMPGDPRA